MSKPSALDLATGLGGQIAKDDVVSAVDKYEKYHGYYGGDEEERKANYSDMVNKYYDLVTSFYEFGWGESFHFAARLKGESLKESIKRHEHFLALQLGLKPGQKVLDVGCGIGGPLREIAQFSLTSVTGLNNNEYQISRGKVLNHAAGVERTCDFVKADFMKMTFPDNHFDAVYAIEATCHAPDVVGCYKEIYRVLKPGQCFAAYEWCMTDSFDPNNREHQKIKAEIELGNGLPDIRLTGQCLEAVKKAGFEVIWEKDLAADSPVPWYLPLDKSHFSLSSFRLTAVGRLITKNLVKALEYVGLAPNGSQRVQDFLEKAAEGLVAGGKYTYKWCFAHVGRERTESGNMSVFINIFGDKVHTQGLKHLFLGCGHVFRSAGSFKVITNGSLNSPLQERYLHTNVFLLGSEAPFRWSVV